MSPIFPALDSKEFDKAYKRILDGIQRLGESFDGFSSATSVSSAEAAAFDEFIGKLNELYEEMRTLRAYIYSFVTTESMNDLAQARMSELESDTVALTKLSTRLEAWIGAVGAETLLELSHAARQHDFAIRRAEVSARHQMSQAEEDLYAELRPTGAGSWGRLHGNVTSRLMVEVDVPEGRQRFPMSRVRAFAHDPNPETRRSAYEAEIEGWKGASVPLAAAINSIKGERNTIVKRRGWPDALEAELFNNNIERTTLDAMQQAVTESFPDFRRYLQAKARLLGEEQLKWWDMLAPLATNGEFKEWDWNSATVFVLEQFGSYSDRMAELARRAFDDMWVDAEPREGKRDGAFCMGVRGDESRVMTNFTGSFGSVGTLAHELGHAYHNLNLAERTPMQRETPMALAETASIFCQNLIFREALNSANEAEKLAILEEDLQTTCQVVVDIHSRFLFESELFAKRQKRALSVDELCDLMVWAQGETYGDGLDANAMHPYMWAMKPHYYQSNFYNWPYTFGLLFGLGLYAQYLDDPESFRRGYDELLASTGMQMAADLTMRFGIDINSVQFWRSSLDIIRTRIADFEKLATPT